MAVTGFDTAIGRPGVRFDANAAYTVASHSPGATVAKPNYQFDKRQRELKKIKEQEEKRQKKLARDAAGTNPAADPGAESTTATSEETKS